MWNQHVGSMCLWDFMEGKSRWDCKGVSILVESIGINNGRQWCWLFSKNKKRKNSNLDLEEEIDDKDDE